MPSHLERWRLGTEKKRKSGVSGWMGDRQEPKDQQGRRTGKCLSDLILWAANDALEEELWSEFDIPRP